MEPSVYSQWDQKIGSYVGYTDVNIDSRKNYNLRPDLFICPGNKNPNCTRSYVASAKTGAGENKVGDGIYGIMGANLTKIAKPTTKLTYFEAWYYTLPGAGSAPAHVFKNPNWRGTILDHYPQDYHPGGNSSAFADGHVEKVKCSIYSSYGAMPRHLQLSFWPYYNGN